MPRCSNRLTILGPLPARTSYVEASAWESLLGACHIEWSELSSERHVCEFITNGACLDQLKEASLLDPSLTLLLDYEIEIFRIKGLARARAGELESYRINY